MMDLANEVLKYSFEGNCDKIEFEVMIKEQFSDSEKTVTEDWQG